MTTPQNQVLEALRAGKGLVAVQAQTPQEFVSELFKTDPMGCDPPRPVIEWDAVDGFLPSFDYPDELPEAGDLFERFSSCADIRAARSSALDARESDVAGDEGRLRKLLRQLSAKLATQADSQVVIFVGQPLPRSLAERLVWIGDDAIEAPASPAATPAASRTADQYHDIRDLKRFDTPEWEERLEKLSVDEAQRIAQSGAYRVSLERISELRSIIKTRFARKDEVIDAICAATIAQIPTVLIGPPGTAKSNLIRCFCEGMGLTAHGETNGDGGPAGRRYFEYLLTRYTTPEEIFGPVHVQDLIDKQEYRRVTAGYLPECQMAFLDEIFKASSAILNTLLTLLNERIFYNGGRAVRVPLMMVFAASNEAPTDEGLQALYDRFPLRLNCQPVADEYVGELLSASWQQSFDRQFGTAQIAVKKCACTNDLRLLRHVMRVRFGGREPSERGNLGLDFGDEFLRFFRSLRTDFGISDRTAAMLLAYCRAQALLNERSEMSLAELDVFRHVVWDESGTGELDRVVSNLKRGIRI